MGKNWKKLGTLTLIGLAAWTSWAAKAQDEPNTRQSLPVAAPQASAQLPPGASSSQSPMIGPGVPLIRPSSQTSGFSSGVGTKGSVAQLRNPFEWEGSVEKHGLFGWIAPPVPRPSRQGARSGTCRSSRRLARGDRGSGSRPAGCGRGAERSGSDAGCRRRTWRSSVTWSDHRGGSSDNSRSRSRCLCLCHGHDRTWVRRSAWRCFGSVSHDRRSRSTIPPAKPAFSACPHADSTRGSQAWQ